MRSDAGRQAAGGVAMDLTGKRILVVEDEYFIASDLQTALENEGAVLVGPVGNLDDGLRLAGSEEIDGALLDVNLGEVRSFPIADRLADREIPYILLTGYDAWALPDAYRAAPRLEKPFEIDRVVQGLGQLFTGDGASISSPRS